MMILTKALSNTNKESPTETKNRLTFTITLEKLFQSLKLLFTSLVKLHSPASQASCLTVQSSHTKIFTY